MTLEKIKNFVKNNKGIIHNFVFHGSRNQNDEFVGYISAFYPAIFTIISNDYQVRSFSYSDLLIGNLEIR